MSSMLEIDYQGITDFMKNIFKNITFIIKSN